MKLVEPKPPRIITVLVVAAAAVDLSFPGGADYRLASPVDGVAIGLFGLALMMWTGRVFRRIPDCRTWQRPGGETWRRCWITLITMWT